MKTLNIPTEADALAEFADLTPQLVPGFRLKYPGFAPDAWWTYRAVGHDGVAAKQPQWESTQSLVREAWDQKFSSEAGLFDLVRLLLSVFDPSGLLEVLIPGTSYRPAFAGIHAIAEEYGFHAGVRWLSARKSWRLKTCDVCKKRFVADHNGRRFCSVNCGKHAESARHVKWGRANNWGRPVSGKIAKSKKANRRTKANR